MEKIIKILKFGNSSEKIEILETLTNTNEVEIIQEIISRLDDDNIQVRGEAFSSLLLNENGISDILIINLKSPKKNIRAFTTLVLANRKDLDAINEIINLLYDEHSMVRSCALGALGYLKASSAKNVIYDCLSDLDIEVKKSALQALIEIGDSIPENVINKILSQNEPELEKILSNAKIEVDRKGFEPSI